MDARTGGKARVRHVAFASKCQVIPWEEIDEDAEALLELERRAREREEKKRRRSSFNVFRSRNSSDQTRSPEPVGDRRSSSSTGSQAGPSSRAMSQERVSRGISPSLPINRNPALIQAAEKQRRKLISPPPQTDPSASPVQHRLALASAFTDAQTFAALSEDKKENSAPSESVVPSLSRPVAVRKPLVLGKVDNEDEEAEDPTSSKQTESPKTKIQESSAKLKVPAIVQVAHSPTSEKGAAKALLGWKADDESDEEETESDEVATLEEELNSECVCRNCEAAMIAALSPGYSPPWSREARKRYLIDQREAKAQAARKPSKLLPSWLRSDSHNDEQGPPVDSAATVKDIQADEVDTKKGMTKKAVLPVSNEAIPQDNKLLATDASLRGEVEQELRMRREEERAKQSRSEMKRLSNDFSSGLLPGGGGARAMMRQLEEAERQEKRAAAQRLRAQNGQAESEKGESRPMGAVKDAPLRPFTVPRRLSDQPDSITPSVPTLLSRTPSPQQKQQQQQEQQSANQKMISPSKVEMAKEKDRDRRHPSPSLLIRRELTLGIPTNSIHVNHKSWPAHPPTRTPSPRLTKPTTLDDIAEVPSRDLTTNPSSGSSTPRRANTIGGHVRQDGSNLKPSSQIANGGAKVKRSSSLSNKPSGLSNELGHGSGLGLNLSHHAAQSGEAGRFGQARHKARNSLKDLVARIKN